MSAACSSKLPEFIGLAYEPKCSAAMPLLYFEFEFSPLCHEVSTLRPNDTHRHSKQNRYELSTLPLPVRTAGSGGSPGLRSGRAGLPI